MARPIMKTFAKTVTTAGTRVQLSTTDLWAREIVIQAKNNTGNIFLGGADVSSANGYILEPLKSFGISDLMDVGGGEDGVNMKYIYIDAATSADGVIVAYMER